MEEEIIKEFVKNKLSEKRYYHSLCVADQCEILAKHYNVDVAMARKIGLIHDVAKELSQEEKLAYVQDNNIEIDEIESKKTSLLHGKIASHIAKKEFGFTEEMCNAIACHTTGRENMTLLDKILYVADGIGLDRTWNDINKVRKMAINSIDDAVLYMLDMAIDEKLLEKDLIHMNSILARNSILKEIM